MLILFCRRATLLLLLAAPALAQTSIATNSPVPLSTRVVDYNIDAQVDTQKHTVDATETLTYRNLTGQPLKSFPFHLYLNAFQPTSTFTTETHFGGGIRDSVADDEYPARKLGSITLTQVVVDGLGDVTGALHFIAPDDGNANDHTVAQLDLPRALAPGEAITFHLRFHDVFPESVARNGYKRDFMMGGQWYPKLGVFWHGAWNCHQYHATTEFFSDFGTFHVRLTLPRDYTVGASGVPTGDATNGNGTRTLSFYAEDVHDFAWAASPHFTVTNATYLSALGPVAVRVLTLPAHPEVARRYLSTTLGSLREFETRFGPYPYKQVTVIDPEPGSEMEGMEYPTLFTGGSPTLFGQPDPTFATELTAEHEFGHQYWYGMVATNEFEDAWLDEGINSYVEVNVMAALEGRDTSVLKRSWANLSDKDAQYLQYLPSAAWDPVTRHAWQFHNSASYAGVTYGKTATLLKTLEGLVGRDTMDAALKTYFERFRFQHPTTEDFLRTIEEVAIERGRVAGAVMAAPQLPAALEGVLHGSTTGPGQGGQMIVNSGLRPYFEQAVYGTRVLDYAVDQIASGPEKWWLPAEGQKTFRSTVTVHRVGDFLLPVTVEVVFKDGTRLEERWAPDTSRSGENDRWKTFTYVRASEVASAEIDPAHSLLLDVDRFNNSRTAKPNKIASRKLNDLWVSAQQLAMQLAGWVV